MSYTNSPLVSYTALSPNNSGTRTHRIDRITPHCIVGQMSVESAGAWFAKKSTQASANYVIGADARVALIVPESQRSWCSSSRGNDQQAVTIECASDKTHPYAFKTEVYMRLIELMTDICRRNGKTKILWFADKAKSLAYKPAENEMLITVHRWFANKACPGDWLYSRLGDVAMKVNAALGTADATKTTSTTAKQILAIGSEESRAKFMLDLVADVDHSGILPSVTTAQMILESGYCSTDLAREANNCFGMKANLSSNTWSSVWDGKSTYTKRTAEQTAAGKVYYVTAAFRKYPDVEHSIMDHSCYLLGAKNGSKQRYAGLTAAKGYREAITIIKAGGYATDVKYVDKICSIIERYHLDRYDSQKAPAKIPEKAVTYIVQAGAFSNVQKAAERLIQVRKIVPDAYLKYEDGMQKIRAGAFSNPKTGKESAESVKERLQSAGIECIIKEV
jgi:flagellum-specific peptidoglycan hydrolase FlgJ